jgi:flagellar basal body-associated protein FliL
MNFRINEKKAQGHSFWIIITAIIALVVVVLIIMWFSGAGGKAFEEVEGKIGSLGDDDGDGVANMFDKCPCDPNIGSEFPEGVTECGIKCLE